MKKILQRNYPELEISFSFIRNKMYLQSSPGVTYILHLLYT